MSYRAHRIDGNARRRPVGEGVRSAWPARSEHEVPEFAALERLARRKSVKWSGGRKELYGALRLSDEEKIEVEAKVIRYLTHNRLPDTLVQEVIMHKLFYKGGDGRTKRVGIGGEGLSRIAESLGLRDRTPRSNGLPRDKAKVKPVQEGHVNGKTIHGPNGSSKVNGTTKTGELADYQREIVADAFSLKCSREEAAKRAGVNGDQIFNLWNDLSMMASPPSRHEEQKNGNKIATIRRFAGMRR
ncbi:MAG: hypothetical protein KGH94_02000 [Candidatus Micrarchaeota archaeon]|nr:hypothetical protein [Candidatus Micrarchaeota archaeon]